VVEANNTRAEVLDRACDRLKRSKANIWGMILNKREFHIPGWIYRFL
jgi:Mrp family chromosome partitioning ATPase